MGLARRVQYAYIEDPKIAQMVLQYPKDYFAKALWLQRHPLILNHFGKSVGGPEKAGVGGSIPSLATILSITRR